MPSYKLNRFPYSRWAVAAVAAAAFHSLRYFTVAKGKVLDTQNIEWLQSKREKQIIKIIKKKTGWHFISRLGSLIRRLVACNHSLLL